MTFIASLKQYAKLALSLMGLNLISNTLPVRAQTIEDLLSKSTIETRAIEELPSLATVVEIMCPPPETFFPIKGERLAYLFELDEEYRRLVQYAKRINSTLTPHSAWEYDAKEEAQREFTRHYLQFVREILPRRQREYRDKFSYSEVTLPPEKTLQQNNREAFEAQNKFFGEVANEAKELVHLSPEEARDIVYHAKLYAHLVWKAQQITTPPKEKPSIPLLAQQKKTIWYFSPPAVARTHIEEEKEIAADFYTRIGKVVKPEASQSSLSSFTTFISQTPVIPPDIKAYVAVAGGAYDYLASRRRYLWDTAYAAETAFLNQMDVKQALEQRWLSSIGSSAAKSTASGGLTQAVLEGKIGSLSQKFFENLLQSGIKAAAYGTQYVATTLSLYPEIQEAREKLLLQLPVIPYRCICNGQIESDIASLNPVIMQQRFETRLQALRQMRYSNVEVIEADLNDYPFMTYNAFDLPSDLCKGKMQKKQTGTVCSVVQEKVAEDDKEMSEKKKRGYFLTSPSHFLFFLKTHPYHEWKEWAERYFDRGPIVKLPNGDIKMYINQCDHSYFWDEEDSKPHPNPPCCRPFDKPQPPDYDCPITELVYDILVAKESGFYEEIPPRLEDINTLLTDPNNPSNKTPFIDNYSEEYTYLMLALLFSEIGYPQYGRLIADAWVGEKKAEAMGAEDVFLETLGTFRDGGEIVSAAYCSAGYREKGRQLLYLLDTAEMKYTNRNIAHLLKQLTTAKTEILRRHIETILRNRDRFELAHLYCD